MTKKSTARIDKMIDAQAARLEKKPNIERGTRLATQQIASDMDRIARDLQSVKDILAALCFQQDDLSLEIPFSSVESVPPGSELEISVDRANHQYIFKLITPQSSGGTES